MGQNNLELLPMMIHRELNFGWKIPSGIWMNYHARQLNIAYQWWNTITSVVPRENITWEFF
ncbi:Gag-Pol polyprotein [Gossypium australe]|uniref:Gag-Pol polyprotein n=1 Tax=Gossypium australe TaxID=47621 RepID=A0A5B6VPF1_9ROSI|nr:Gag-Pol polyprotein [Gossypium australe]